MRRALPLILLTVLLAACGGAGTSPSATGGAVASNTATCQQAPTVADDLAGWGQPSSAPAVIPVYIAPSIATCGESRVLFGLVGPDGRPIADANRQARFAFFDLGRDKDKPFATVDGTFIWAIQDAVGIYAMQVAFPEAGSFGAEVTTSTGGGAPTTTRMRFEVHPTSPVVRVGDKAPSIKTPTLADVGGDPTKISTDATPDPSFYTTSVDQALAAHKPFVLIFATPKFCTSGQCGPTLERIKPFLAKFPTVTFINVEPYKLKLVNGVLQADVDANNQLQTTAISDAWHLVSEPNIYVVNKDGVVTANYELIFSDAELTAALNAIK